jgi:hypothetical protein
VSEFNRPGRPEKFRAFDDSNFNSLYNIGAGLPAEHSEQRTPSPFPPDFSADEFLLATELEEYFSVEREELPPLFTETLGAPRRFPAATDGFEQRVTSHVFRNLRLTRCLFPTRRRFWVLSPRWALRRSALVLSMLMCVLMLLSAIVTSPSFARGLQVLLTHQTGVYLTDSYPQHVQTIPEHQHVYVNLAEAVHALPYTLYWPTALPSDYGKKPLIELPGARSYTNGPLVDLEFMAAQGGELSIREFRPAPGMEVLQLADDGSSQVLPVGSGVAIYVSGGWDRQLRWVVGERSEIVYERDGVAFWIVSEGLHPLDAPALLAIIDSLQPVNEQIIAQYDYGANLREYGMELAGALRETSANDIVAVLPSQAAEGPARFIATGGGLNGH